MNFIENIGSLTLKMLALIGGFIIFAFEAILGIFHPKEYFKNFLIQLKEIGFYSLPVVGMTALFSGAVLALQSFVGFSRFSAESSVATVVVLSITRELAPVLAGLMLAGRIGASIAAEIATMRVTEQIDALITLSTNPIRYLVTPKLLAGIIALPLLVLVADIIGVMGGYMVSVYNLGFNEAYYINNSFKYLEAIDIISGLTKAFIFGIIVTLVGSYSGYNSDKGAKGVGKATIAAVVYSSMLILAFNYIITQIFF